MDNNFKLLETLFSILAKTSLTWFALMTLFNEKEFKEKLFNRNTSI